MCTCRLQKNLWKTAVRAVALRARKAGFDLVYVYAGRRYAEELDGPPVTGDEVPFKREITELFPEG